MPGRYRDSHPWPFYALRITTPRLELRVPDDEDIVELFAAAQAGIHPAGEMPFGVPWTDSLHEQGALERFLSFHWASRGAITAEKWSLPFAVVSDGAIVGTQELLAEDFARRAQRVQRFVADGSGSGPRPRRRDARGSAAPCLRRARRARGTDLGVARQPRLPARVATSGLRARGTAAACASRRAHARTCATGSRARRGSRTASTASRSTTSSPACRFWALHDLAANLYNHAIMATPTHTALAALTPTRAR